MESLARRDERGDDDCEADTGRFVLPLLWRRLAVDCSGVAALLEVAFRVRIGELGGTAWLLLPNRSAGPGPSLTRQ